MKMKCTNCFASIAMVIAVLAMGFFTSCNNGQASLTLDKTVATITVGDEDQLSATAMPNNLAINWSSSNASIATVSATGLVTAVAPGMVEITATIQPTKGEPVTAVCAYTIEEAPVDSLECAITLKDSAMHIKVGKTKKIEYTIVPEVEGLTMAFESNNIKVATVEEGVVKGVAKGAAVITITATSEDGQQVSTVLPVVVDVNDGLDLGYAIYKGDVRNGKPHGNGTMTFKRSYDIPGTRVYAYPGEKVTGTWRDGKINMGTFYRNNGETPLVKVGQTNI